MENGDQHELVPTDGWETVDTDRVASPHHVVGIGASAGGLEAIDSFFSNMPVDTGAAFVVIQHLSPDHKSMMVELLSKRTAMTVVRAEDGQAIQSDTVYVIPPRKNLTVFHARLMLSDQEAGRGINLPIDVFFRSLADDQGDKAIGIVLSGTGSDGMRGVRAVKGQGGMVMVQDEQTARFDGMPRSAISTGLTDFVCPPEEMPEHLVSYFEHPFVAGEKPAGALLNNEESLLRVFAMIRERHRVDFTYYKMSTVVRRIERRISVTRTADLGDYIRYMEQHPKEITLLYRELLIGVTNFFRDSSAFGELRRTHLPALLRNAGREVRFWVPGCSTGEEAYSLTITALEVIEEQHLHCDLKIFATDIDQDAVTRAANGEYPESIAADVPVDILSKYFYKRGDTFQVTREVREKVVFAQHNLVRDAPFTNIDLVSCRNLLIYLQPVLQRRALELFNFALNKGGVLFLGSSETVGEMVEYFEPLNHRWKLYQSKGRRRLTLTPDGQPSPTWNADGVRDWTRRPAVGNRQTHQEDRMLQRFLEFAAKEYLPLVLIVNEQLELLHTIGDVSEYVRIPSGRVSADITKMAVKELAIPIATAVQKTLGDEPDITYSNIRIHINESETRMVNLRVSRLPERKTQEVLLAVFIQEVTREQTGTPGNALATYDLSRETEQRMHDLEQELQFTRENLQATIEELETANEELQATNEELLASNEELQSTNEELQSVNEELHTVNAEYQAKIMELTDLNNDIENLLRSTSVATAFLDENLEIRRASESLSRFFDTSEKLEGSPVGVFDRMVEGVDISRHAKLVRDTNQPWESEIVTNDGLTCIVRIRPYQVAPNAYSGVVVTLVDTSELSQARSALKQSETRYEELFHSLPNGVIVYRLDRQTDQFVIESINPSGARMGNVSVEQSIGRPLLTVFPKVHEFGICDALRRAIDNGETIELPPALYKDERTSVWVRSTFYAVSNELAVGVFNDLTGEIEEQRAREISEERLTRIFSSTGLGWWDWDVTAGPVCISCEFLVMLGFERTGGPGRSVRWSDVVHIDDAERINSLLYQVNSGEDGSVEASGDAAKTINADVTPEHQENRMGMERAKVIPGGSLEHHDSRLEQAEPETNQGPIDPQDNRIRPCRSTGLYENRPEVRCRFICRNGDEVPVVVHVGDYDQNNTGQVTRIMGTLKRLEGTEQ